MTRRDFVRLGAGALGAAGGTFFYTWRIEPHRLEIVKRPLEIRRLPPSLAGRTLVHLSDIHVGPRVDDEYVRNNVHDIDGFQIAGLDDLWSRRFDLDATLRQLDKSRAALVLSHNPDAVDLPGWDGYESWIFAGHTHGGQCKPPFLPPPLLPVANRRYTSGEFGLSGNRKMYISRGVGHLLHVRFNVRPEVTVFELRRA